MRHRESRARAGGVAIDHPLGSRSRAPLTSKDNVPTRESQHLGPRVCDVCLLSRKAPRSFVLFVSLFIVFVAPPPMSPLLVVPITSSSVGRATRLMMSRVMCLLSREAKVKFAYFYVNGRVNYYQEDLYVLIPADGKYKQYIITIDFDVLLEIQVSSRFRLYILIGVIYIYRTQMCSRQF